MEQPNTSPPQELKNELIRFTLHHKPACITECDAEALEPLITKAHKQAVRAVSKHVTLPGFRKGKAPEELIVRNHPEDVDKEWQQCIADACVKECLNLASIDRLSQGGKISYQMKSHSSKGALLTLLFETEPKVPHVEAEKMQLKEVKRPEVNDEKIEETIRQSQLFFAKWESVTDRPIKVGDFVSLDLDVIETTPKVPLFSDTRFEVTEKSMAKWMFDLVVGKNIGDQVEGISEPGEDATEEEKQELSQKKVLLTIRSIETAILPELTEDFVKQLGVSSLDEMRTNVTNLLNKQADEHLIEEKRKQASDFLLTQYPFDLPETLIVKETEFRFRQLWNDPSFQKYWTGLSQEEKNKMIHTVKEQSEKAVRLFYMCRQVLTDAQISIKPEDVETGATAPMDLIMDLQQKNQEKNPEIQRAEAYSKLVLEKAQDFVLRHASKS